MDLNEEAQEILQRVKDGRFRLLHHATQRSQERGVFVEQVIHCAKTCFHWEWQENHKTHLYLGFLGEKKPGGFTAVLLDEALVVTVFKKEAIKMGKESREIRKTLKGVGNLDYVEVKNVPMKSYPGYGDSVDAHILGQIEKQVARELIVKRFPARGVEVEYFRSVFGLSQRDFAEKLGLSHVSVLKWEKAKLKPLGLVNEVAVKVLVAGMLGLKLPASIETFTSEHDIPKKLILEYVETQTNPKARLLKYGT